MNLSDRSYLERIARELPVEIKKLMAVFREACSSDFEVKSEVKEVVFIWRRGVEAKIGPLKIEQLHIEFQNKTIDLTIDSDLGCWNLTERPTAKVAFSSPTFKDKNKLPFIRDGFFIDINDKKRKSNRILYLDKEYEWKDITSEIAIATLKPVFFEKDP